MINLHVELSAHTAVNVKGIILKSYSSFCFDVWAGEQKENAGKLVGTEISLTIQNGKPSNIALAPKAEWKIKEINGNILDIGYLHIDMKDNKPDWSCHGQKDLLIEVKEVTPI